ncbi:MAG TPA: SagB family peptide dehydrogenase, partial [Actinomycetes bacterium]|nr:SagB family peptide dehydrogenase [Actinomycetes bacterium]
RLRPDVYLATDRNGQEYLLHRSASQRLGRLTDLQRDVIRRLAASECSDESMRAAARSQGDDRGVAELDELLDRLRSGGWLYITVVHDGRPAYTIEPYRTPTGLHPGDPETDQVLSRFAVLHRSDGDLLVESPRSWCAIRVHDPGVVAALAAFIEPGAGTTAGPTPGSLPAPLAARLLSDLTWAAMLVEASGDEETAFALRQWSPHELWFHHRSRREGVPDRHFGRTQWAVGLFEPLPARRPSFAGRVIELRRPDLDALRRTDATLTGVLEERRSIRRHDDERPISLDQIGEFLYRAAGVRRTVAHEGVEYLTGPNPSGGALDALEFYVAVRLAESLEPGLYRYDRFDHRLEQVCAMTRPARKLIEAAQSATTGTRFSPQTYPPQLVVLLAARFGRVGWSYETLAYSLILKHVGVTYQTMYCVATAMGLAPCALGAGDSAAFAEATGLDPLTEGTVGEFILGSRPPASSDGSDRQAAT